MALCELMTETTRLQPFILRATDVAVGKGVAVSVWGTERVREARGGFLGSGMEGVEEATVFTREVDVESMGGWGVSAAG